VFVGRHLDHHRAQVGPKLLQQIEIFCAGVAGGSDDGDAPFKQVGIGMAGASPFAAGQGMTAEKPAAPRQRAVQRVDDRSLGAAGIRDQGTFATRCGRLPHTLHDSTNGRAHDNQLGFSDAFGQIDAGMAHGTDAARNPQTFLAPPDADNLVGQIPLTQGQTDRATDQPYPHDGDAPQPLHWCNP
jgi:hypothetical protein